MGHGTENDPRGAVGEARAERMAGALQAIAEPVRLQALTALRQGPAGLDDLSSALGVETSKLTTEMDRLVAFGLVMDDGTSYALHDDHVASLLDEAIGHDSHQPG